MGRAMTKSMGKFPLDTRGGRPSARLSAFLTQRYRGAGAPKRLAADLGCQPKTAENMLGGSWPSDMHLAAIVRRFGADVWRALFAVDLDAEDARLALEESRLAQALDETRARRRPLSGALAGGSGVRAEYEAVVAPGDQRGA